MDLTNVLKKRYSTKKFDPTKKISSDNLEKIKDLLQLSPSSTNLQPWHFILATTEHGKKRIAKSAEGFYKFNEDKILEASAVVVFATKVDITDDFIKHANAQEDKDGRFIQEQFKKDNYNGRKKFANIHKYDYKDTFHWAEKQTYLNLGVFLLGLGVLDIDAVAMEGVNMKILDEEFNLREKGFTASFVVALGYHASDDFNATLPKSRLSKDEIIEEI